MVSFLSIIVTDTKLRCRLQVNAKFMTVFYQLVFATTMSLDVCSYHQYTDEVVRITFFFHMRAEKLLI